MVHDRKYDVLAWATHRRPHLDEMATRFISELAHEGRLGPIEHPLTIAPDARFVAWEFTGGASPDGRTAEEWFQQDGVLAIGVGGGEFDEHHNNGYATLVPYCKRCEKSGVYQWCATDLMAKRLGVLEHPKLRAFLAGVHGNDCHGTGSWSERAKIIMDAHRVHNPDAEAHYQFFKQLLFEEHWAKQTQFFSAAEPFARAGITDHIHVHWDDEDTELSVALIRPGREGANADDPDHEWIIDWAASDFGGAHQLIIRQSTSGNIQVIPKDKRLLGVMPAVTAVVRYLETHFAGRALRLSFTEMSENKTKAEIPNWHFQRETGCLFNGSAMYRAVQPTRIPFQVLVRAIFETIPRNRVVAENWDDISGFVRWQVGLADTLRKERERPAPVASDAAPASAAENLPRREEAPPKPKKEPARYADGKEPFKRAGKTHVFNVLRGNQQPVEIPFAVIRQDREGTKPGDADHPQVMAWAASQEGGQHGVVIRQAASGHVEIAAFDPNLFRTFPALTAVLRYLESAESDDAIRADFTQMSAGGTVSVAPNWHLAEGRLTNIGMPTAIPLDAIAESVIYVVPRNRMVERAWDDISNLLKDNIPQLRGNRLRRVRRRSRDRSAE